MKKPDLSAQALQHFLGYAQGLELEVLQDEGMHRHVRLVGPSCWFELVTVPNSLIVSGSFGSHVFRERGDLFKLFRREPGDINPAYWSQKLTSNDQAGVRAFSEELFLTYVIQDLKDRREEWPPGLLAAVRDEVTVSWWADLSTRDGALSALHNFDHKGFEFHGMDEWDIEDWTCGYLWSLYAIVWGIRQYDEHKARTPAAV